MNVADRNLNPILNEVLTENSEAGASFTTPKLSSSLSIKQEPNISPNKDNLKVAPPSQTPSWAIKRNFEKTQVDTQGLPEKKNSPQQREQLNEKEKSPLIREVKSQTDQVSSSYSNIKIDSSNESSTHIKSSDDKTKPRNSLDGVSLGASIEPEHASKTEAAITPLALVPQEIKVDITTSEVISSAPEVENKISEREILISATIKPVTLKKRESSNEQQSKPKTTLKKRVSNDWRATLAPFQSPQQKDKKIVDEEPVSNISAALTSTDLPIPPPDGQDFAYR